MLRQNYASKVIHLGMKFHHIIHAFSSYIICFIFGNPFLWCKDWCDLAPIALYHTLKPWPVVEATALKLLVYLKDIWEYIRSEVTE